MTDAPWSARECVETSLQGLAKGALVGLLMLLVFRVWPGLDLAVSRLFHEPGAIPPFPLDRHALLAPLVGITRLMAQLALAGAVLWFLRCLWRARQRPQRRMLAWRSGILALALVLGPGIIVDKGMKDVWGRARPRDVVQFEGTKAFTPAWQLSTQCARNCSFTSGHAAAGFAPVAGWFVARRRRRALWLKIGLGVGLAMSLMRVAVGGHFASDVLFAGWVDWMVAAAVAFAVSSWMLMRQSMPKEDMSKESQSKEAVTKEAVTREAESREAESREPASRDPASRDDTPASTREAPAGKAPNVSIVIPIYNEGENVRRLVDAVGDAIAPTGRSFELILVDDGSQDDTRAQLRAIANETPWLRCIFLARNYGQSTALQAGFDHAWGNYIVTLDGDLQNDPKDIPGMLDILDTQQDVDCVSGWRKNRQDKTLSRKIPSVIANALISRVTRVELHDYGCALKAYRARIVHDLHLYGELHRFIPALAKEVGARIIEVPVNHHPRTAGKSKYGIDRTIRVLLDLMLVRFMMRFLHRPIHAFGGVAFGMLVGGVAILAWLTFEKLILGADIGGRPLLLLGVLLTLVGVQLIAAGLLGELLIRIYHEPFGRKQYLVRPVEGGGAVHPEDVGMGLRGSIGPLHAPMNAFLPLSPDDPAKPESPERRSGDR